MRTLRFGGCLTLAVIAGSWLASSAVWSSGFMAAAWIVVLAGALAGAWREVWLP